MMLLFLFPFCALVTKSSCIRSDADSQKSSKNLALDLESLNHLSSELKSEECLQVYTFLLAQESGRQVHQNLDIMTSKEYAKQLENSREVLKHYNSANKFNCSNALSYWNRKMIPDVIDKRHVAETLLAVSLSTAGRSDLEHWLHEHVTQLWHNDNEKLKSLINSHRHANTSQGPEVTKTGGSWRFLILEGILSSVLVFGILCIAVNICCTDRDKGLSQIRRHV